MATYDALISTGNVDLRPEFLSEIFKAASESSVVLKLARQLRNMTTREMKLKVSTALPEVFFVGEKGLTQSFPADALKQTTKSEWEDVSMYAGELAAIVVVPNTVFNDADFDIFGEIRRQIPTAIAKKIDEAVLYGNNGVDVPDDWSDGIMVKMPAENKVADTLGGDIYDAILGPAGVYAQVEADGYDVNGVAAAIQMKAALRGLRDDSGTGMPLFTNLPQGATQYALAGIPLDFPKNGAFNASTALLIAGDWDQLVYSLRQDVAFDVFTTGVIQDGNGTIKHNLLQEDLTALRVTFRMGWALPNPVQHTVASGTGFPFAALID